MDIVLPDLASFLWRFVVSYSQDREKKELDGWIFRAATVMQASISISEQTLLDTSCEEKPHNFPFVQIIYSPRCISHDTAHTMTANLRLGVVQPVCSSMR